MELYKAVASDYLASVSNIYINELIGVLEEYNVEVKMFADDVKCGHNVKLYMMWTCGLFATALTNALNSLPVNNVDFSTLTRFRCTISKVNFLIVL